MKQLEAFFNDLENSLASTRELRKRVDRELSTSFSVFDYISRDERVLSRIIADLLNPEGSHGQGCLFLEIFLQKLNSPFLVDWRTSLTRASVQREVYTNPSRSNRSIDVLVTLGSAEEPCAIGIENKPFAKEGNNQLSLYFDDLDRHFKKRSILIFLSTRRSPESIERQKWDELKSQGRAFDWNFNGLFYDWLSECRLRCDSQKLRFFIRDLQLYVKSNLKNPDDTE